VSVYPAYPLELLVITPADYERFRRLNFGARIPNRPITVSAVRDELRRYDAASAREVSSRARGEVGLEPPAMDALIALYGEAIAAHGPIDLRAALHDAGRYMASITDVAKGRLAEAMALHLARTEAYTQGERARRGEEELSASRAEHERLAGLLGARNTALADTQGKLAELRARAAAQQTALADAEGELAKLRARAAAQQTALADVKTTLARLRSRGDRLEARLAERNQPWSLRLGWRRAKKVALKQPLAALRRR
jgi:hypothetical protein